MYIKAAAPAMRAAKGLVDEAAPVDSVIPGVVVDGVLCGFEYEVELPGVGGEDTTGSVVQGVETAASGTLGVPVVMTSVVMVVSGQGVETETSGTTGAEVVGTTGAGGVSTGGGGAADVPTTGTTGAEVVGTIGAGGVSTGGGGAAEVPTTGITGVDTAVDSVSQGVDVAS